MSETKQESKKSKYLVIIFLLLAINLVVGFFFFKNIKDSDAKIEAKEVEIVDLKDDLDVLQKDFNNQLAELEQMKGINAELDAVLAEREKEIKAHLSEIQKWKNQSNYNKGELNKLKDKIVEFESEKMAFKAQIEQLSEENAQLKEIKIKLENDLGIQKDSTAMLNEENNYLADKFEIGSLLQADELTASGIKVKNNGAEKEVNKIKATEKIMVCYQTGENKVREPGEVKMQLRLINPNGETMYLEPEGSSTFKSKENGEELRYTKQASFAFDGTNKKICIYWSHNITEAGTYTAEIYQEGYLVGVQKFDLN